MVQIKQYRKLKKETMPKTAKNQLASLLESKKENKERRLKLRQQLMTAQLTWIERRWRRAHAPFSKTTIKYYFSAHCMLFSGFNSSLMWLCRTWVFQWKKMIRASCFASLSKILKRRWSLDKRGTQYGTFIMRLFGVHTWHFWQFKFELYGLTLVSLLPSAGHCPDVVVPQSRDQKIPLLKAQIDLNPIGGPDLAVDCSAQPFTITYNRDFTERLSKLWLNLTCNF